MKLPPPLVLLSAALAAATLLAQEGRVIIKAVPRDASRGPAGGWREGEAIVAFRAGVEPVDVERALRFAGARAARRARSAARYLVKLDPGTSVEEGVRGFSGLAEVDYAEPNGIVRRSQARTFTPDDRLYRYQWNMRQIGAERTWGIQKGSRSVAVAVLDSGVAYEDYTDPRTGRVYRKAPDWGDTVFLPGYDFVNRDDHPNDDEYHGTHVASTIAEATNNAIGMAGLAFGCAIMPVKVLDETGTGSFFDVADGIDYAADFSQNGENPVKVINMSLGTELFSETVKRAIDRAAARGVVLVAAAGNSGKGTVEFPASLANVIAVGALDQREERAFYSNTGSDLDLVAPGGNCDRDDDSDGEGDCVFQQMPDPNPDFVGEFCYCGLDGTSMAAPHVAAAAALLVSQGITDAAAVRAALEQTAKRLGGAPEGGRNDSFGNGLIRPAAALSGLGFNQGPVR